MLCLRDVFAHSATSCLLHGGAVERGALPQRLLLIVGQSQRHRHALDGINQIPLGVTVIRPKVAAVSGPLEHCLRSDRTTQVVTSPEDLTRRRCA